MLSPSAAQPDAARWDAERPPPPDSPDGTASPSSTGRVAPRQTNRTVLAGPQPRAAQPRRIAVHSTA